MIQENAKILCLVVTATLRIVYYIHWDGVGKRKEQKRGDENRQDEYTRNVRIEGTEIEEK